MPKRNLKENHLNAEISSDEESDVVLQSNDLTLSNCNTIHDMQTSDDNVNIMNQMDMEELYQASKRSRKQTSVGGVTWIAKISKFHAFLKINAIDYMIGYYLTEEEANAKLALATTHLASLHEGVNELEDSHLKRIFFSEYIQKYIDSSRKVNKSQYRGVSWSQRDKRWIAQITLNTIKYHIGSYDNEQKAKEARDIVYIHKDELQAKLQNIEDRKIKMKVFADFVHPLINPSNLV